MTTTPTTRRDRFADDAAGLIYLEPAGPALPGLTARGLGYIRDDCLADAARADEQAETARAERNWTLVTICETVARAKREVARQIATYALEPSWQAQS